MPKPPVPQMTNQQYVEFTTAKVNEFSEQFYKHPVAYQAWLVGSGVLAIASGDTLSSGRIIRTNPKRDVMETVASKLCKGLFTYKISNTSTGPKFEITGIIKGRGKQNIERPS